MEVLEGPDPAKTCILLEASLKNEGFGGPQTCQILHIACQSALELAELALDELELAELELAELELAELELAELELAAPELA